MTGLPRIENDPCAVFGEIDFEPRDLLHTFFSLLDELTNIAEVRLDWESILQAKLNDHESVNDPLTMALDAAALLLRVMRCPKTLVVQQQLKNGLIVPKRMHSQNLVLVVHVASFPVPLLERMVLLP